ncbi:hypothetical protein HK405_015823, partial [Cladochytrium tenue]
MANQPRGGGGATSSPHDDRHPHARLAVYHTSWGPSSFPPPANDLVLIPNSTNLARPALPTQACYGAKYNVRDLPIGLVTDVNYAFYDLRPDPARGGHYVPTSADTWADTDKR